MSCKYAAYDSEDGRWQCSVSGDGCMYLIPNSKRCAIDYGEGPDADRDHNELLSELESEQRQYKPKHDTDYDDWDDEE